MKVKKGERENKCGTSDVSTVGRSSAECRYVRSAVNKTGDVRIT